METETHQQSEADDEESELSHGQWGRALSGCQRVMETVDPHFPLGAHSEVLMTVLFQKVLLRLFLIEVCVKLTLQSM